MEGIDKDSVDEARRALQNRKSSLIRGNSARESFQNDLRRQKLALDLEAETTNKFLAVVAVAYGGAYALAYTETGMAIAQPIGNGIETVSNYARVVGQNARMNACNIAMAGIMAFSHTLNTNGSVTIKSSGGDVSLRNGLAEGRTLTEYTNSQRGNRNICR